MKSLIHLLVCAVVVLLPVRLVGQQPEEPVAEAGTGSGWTPLFDGVTLDGWQPRGATIWRAEGGAISPLPGSGRGHLVTREPFTDFELALEFWADDEVNSGVFIRAPDAGEITQSNAFEVNIYDAHTDWPTGSINEIQRGAIVPQTVGRWNDLLITARGDHLLVELNGEKVVDTRASRLPGGPISLQYNGSGEIRFRNLRLRILAE